MKTSIKKGVQQALQSNAKPQMATESHQRYYNTNVSVLSNFEPYCTILNNIGSGEENAIHLTDLRIKTDLQDRELRKCIEDLRRSGTVITSSPKGYFKPQNRSEVDRYIRQETHRAKSIFYTLKHARELNKTFEEVGE